MYSRIADFRVQFLHLLFFNLEENMNKLYPLKFKTIFKDKLWGGSKVKTVLGKDFGDLPNCGETWEISGVPGNVSVVAEGPLAGKDLNEILAAYQADLVGKKVYAENGNEFPLLVKFIDANDDLSIQVHPDDELARKRHNSLGKTEMWYILEADEGATLISGFNQPLTREKYEEYFNAGKLEEILNKEQVAAGDVFFLPAGRVHTIGKGLLLAEIQQTSDVTYRIYDFDRVDAEGNKRELHVEEALDAIDYKHYDEYKSPYDPSINKAEYLAGCNYFKTNRLYFDQSITRNYSDLDSFVIYVVAEGKGQIEYGGEKVAVSFGDCLLIPAVIDEVTVVPDGEIKVLESFVP